MRPWLLVTSLLVTVGQFAATDGVLARSFSPNMAGHPNMTGTPGFPPPPGNVGTPGFPRPPGNIGTPGFPRPLGNVGSSGFPLPPGNVGTPGFPHLWVTLGHRATRYLPALLARWA